MTSVPDETLAAYIEATLEYSRLELRYNVATKELARASALLDETRETMRQKALDLANDYISSIE